jgi:beta-lactamase class A
MRLLPAILVAMVVVAPSPAAPPARAQTPPAPEAVLREVFTSPQLRPEWFAPSFLALVPLGQAQQVIDGYKQQLGAFRSVERAGDAYIVRFEGGAARATLVLDAAGVITGFVLGTPQFADKAAAFQSAVQALSALPGRVSFLAGRGDAVAASRDPGVRLAVGSAFKLAVLAAVQEQVTAGKHAWDEVVRLRPEWKSLPSGVLQSWPDGIPLTIQTLAAQMISVSDNTAADALIDIVGREAVQKYASGNDPFLTTREAFLLKSPKLSELLERYRAATAEQRRNMLPEINAQPRQWLSVDLTYSPDIEWFFSAGELCALMANVGDSPVFQINTGGVDTAAWQRVAFKGGSEPGVLNLTYGLKAYDGTTACVVATWNDASANEETLFPIVQQLIQGLE